MSTWEIREGVEGRDEGLSLAICAVEFTAAVQSCAGVSEGTIFPQIFDSRELPN